MSGRRRVLGLLAVAFAPTACGGDGDTGDRTARAAAPVSGSFVGTVPGTQAQVAVVAARGDGGEARPVRIYVCETEVHAEWFTGSARGNEVRLRSTSGKSTLTARLSRAQVEGRVTLPDGETRSFSATPARGIAGLYEVTVGRDGRVAGSSDRGVRVAGRIHERGDERRALTATLIGPAGERRPIATETTGVPPFGGVGRGRWIINARGDLSGAVKSGDDPAIWAGPNPR
jgi:hypothetical protein